MNTMLLWMIGLYQKHLSPRKGFRCAYSVLNRTHGCSGQVALIIEDKGVWKGRHDIKAQFRHCKEAAAILKKDRKDKSESHCYSTDASPCGDAVQKVDCSGCSDCTLDCSF
ncbi:membrane protein insertion efficiency factor YidD [Vibrio splendidus]